MSTTDSFLSLQGLGRFRAERRTAPPLMVDVAALDDFNTLLSDVCEESRELQAAQLEGAAQQALRWQADGVCPFVARRMQEATLLRRMLRDEDWPLASALRERIERVLDYIDRAEDLIPDSLPVIGLLDDAILVELFLRRAGGELGDYEDYCSFRHELAERLCQREALLHVPVEDWLSVRRQALSAQRERRRSPFVATPGHAPFRIR